MHSQADRYQLFVDFGSTFTKIVALDLEKEVLAARVQVPSSVDHDITIGLHQGLSMLQKELPIGCAEVAGAVACSSAAGGLRMLCIGLVPEYTTEAGRMAALGAGAKLIKSYSYELLQDDLDEIKEIAPDIILLTGGTDGGNRRVIVHNAGMLSQLGQYAGHIIVAGNRSATDEIRSILNSTGYSVHYAENVMPTLGRIRFEPVSQTIRAIFIGHITTAKGIASAERMIGGVIMPTPAAVLEAAKLIALGVPGEKGGMGELLLVDVGGATTDVYSIAAGLPSQEGTYMTGLEEPYEKRTVEGDLGLYHNLDTLDALAKQQSDAAPREARNATLEALHIHRSIPGAMQEAQYQMTLSRLAVKTAVERHVGTVEMQMTNHGKMRRQKGKDLTEIKQVIGAGGPVCFSENPRYVLEGASEFAGAHLLKPLHPRYLIDSAYILFAIGLLAQTQPKKALNIIQAYLKEV